MELDALAAAGLYDPAAPDAAERADLLRYLVEAGASIDEMVASNAEGNLSSLVFDRRLSRGDLSPVELAERVGTPLDDVVEVYRLLGIPIADPSRPTLAASEARLFELVAVARPTLPEGMTEEILRSIGTALTLVAESTVSAFVGSVEGLLEQGTPLARAEFTSATGELGLELGSLLEPLLRHHLWGAVVRQRAAMRTSHDRLESQVSIGFVDLVGFTAATASMGSTELLAFMQGFQQRAFDVVAAAQGRLVKHIGDEIMFASPDAVRGCEIALALIEAFPESESLPRGGLAHGMVVARHGDFYGPVVNLAARLADIAVPGEVLAAASIADAAEADHLHFEPAGQRQLKGFADPVQVVSVRRVSS
ncbi:MAG: adenylate/guanylate cyclase domain-containing protein [Acidimicrobiales bacterium]